MDPVLNETAQKIQDALEHFKHELATIRAGRANPSLIEELPVMAYGTRMKLMEIGTIGAPQPTLLTIQVWDPGLMKDVEKAILESSLGLNPSNDGQTIRLSIPPLSEERRQEFVKMAHVKGEACKVEIRQIRGDQKDDFEEDQKSGTIGEDEYHKLIDQLQKLVDNAVEEVDKLVKEKEADLMEV